MATKGLGLTIVNKGEKCLFLSYRWGEGGKASALSALFRALADGIDKHFSPDQVARINTNPYPGETGRSRGIEISQSYRELLEAKE